LLLLRKGDDDDAGIGALSGTQVEALREALVKALVEAWAEALGEVWGEVMGNGLDLVVSQKSQLRVEKGQWWWWWWGSH